MRRHRKRDLGLTTEEWIEILGSDPEFLSTMHRDMDVKGYVHRRLEMYRELAEKTLRDLDLPHSGLDALQLNEDSIPPNAVLARRILSAIGECQVHVQTDRDAQAFIVGTEIERWERQLSTNLSYESAVRAHESQHKPKVTDAQIVAANKKHSTQKGAADSVGLSVRQFRTRLKRIP